MRDHDDSGLGLGDDFQQLVLQLGAGQRVQRAERFVEQQHFGLHRQGSGNADALLHAAGDFAGALLRGGGQTDHRQHRIGARLELGFAFGGGKHALDRQIDVFKAGQPRQQRVVLKHHGALRAGASDFAVGAQQYTLRGQGQPGDQVEQRRFAAARVADQGDKLALGDLEVDILQRAERAFFRLEGLFDTLDVDVLGVGRDGHGDAP